jgi:DNA mismatch endonuclease (patch repair protein)
MSRVRGRDTAPELRVRRALHVAGFRFRLQRRDLPGRPDLVLPRYRVALFVHGCFWHGHDCRKGRRPSSNTDFWNAKLDANIARDAAAAAALTERGWTVRTIWECEAEAQTAALLEELAALRDHRSNEATK